MHIYVDVLALSAPRTTCSSNESSRHCGIDDGENVIHGGGYGSGYGAAGTETDRNENVIDGSDDDDDDG